MALSDADVQKQVSKINSLYVIQQTCTLLIQRPSLLSCSTKHDVIFTIKE